MGQNNLLDQIPFESYYQAHIKKGKRKGDEYQGLCPFHDDSISSFSVNITNGLWKCHAGCGDGNILSFHAKLKGISTKEAYKDLLDQYNLYQPATKPKTNQISTKTIEKYQAHISDKIIDALQKRRGWSKEIIEKYRIGYNPDNQRLMIPVFDQQGICRNIRQYSPKPAKGQSKIWSWKEGYGTSRLYPIEILKQINLNTPIIICEGEPDTLCGLSQGLSCITQTAGAGGWEKRFNRYFKERHVIIIYDNDQPGREGARKVADNLKKVVGKLEILQWPDWMEEKQDLTDWFVTHKKNKEDLLALPRKEIDTETSLIEDPEKFLPELNSKHAVVMIGGKCVILNETYDPVFRRQDITFSSPSDFKNYYANRFGLNGDGTLKSIARIWWDSPKRRQYEGIVFEPEQDFPGYYNLWSGFAVEPKQGDWSLFRYHIEQIIAGGVKERSDYIFAWMARIIQDPGGERPGTSIVLRGRMGTGKGVFVNQFGALFGKHYIQIAQASQIVGRFNSHLKDALLVFIDEGFWAGDNQAEGVIKNIITEPFITIEPKGKDIIRVKNNVNMIIASNNEWIVPAGLEERRFFVIDIPDDHQQDHEYFGAIIEQMDNGGREAMLYDLLRYDYSGVDLRTFERTEGLLDQIIASMTPVQKWWFEKLREGVLLKDHDEWVEKVDNEELYKDYLGFCEMINVRYPKINSQFYRELNTLCDGIENYRPRILDSTGRIMRIQQKIFPGLSKCRDQFQIRTGINYEWEQDEDEEEDIPF